MRRLSSLALIVGVVLLATFVSIPCAGIPAPPDEQNPPLDCDIWPEYCGGGGGGGGYTGSCYVCVQSMTVHGDGTSGPLVWECMTLYQLGLSGTGNESCSVGGDGLCRLSGAYCQSVNA